MTLLDRVIIMVKENKSRDEISKYMSQFKKKNISTGKYESLTKTDVSDLLLLLII